MQSWILDDWESQYLSAHELLKIPWCDPVAFEFYPKDRWLYDKYQMHRALNPDVPIWNLNNETPNWFPIFVRPRFNLEGMSVGAHAVSAKTALGSYRNYIATPLKAGTQISVDMAFENGRLIEYFAFEAVKNGLTEFDHFRSIDRLPEATLARLSEIGPLLKQERAIVNAELIDNLFVEIHLRPSLQFYDISGGFLPHLIHWLAGKPFPKIDRSFTVSKIYRRPTDAYPKKPSSIPPLPAEIRSLQFTWYDGLPLSACTNDSTSYRYLVINGTSLRVIEDFARNFIPQLMSD